jgi:hypothetical protein
MPSVDVVKKVKPYPISCGIMKAEGQPAIAAEIVKLTEVGFLMRIPAEHLLRVGDNLLCQFELPGEDLVVAEKIKVIKVYHGLESLLPGQSPPAMAEKASTIELHFRTLDPMRRGAIQRFIKKIGQS